MGCLGEEATSEGRLGRGSGGEERLGEGGGEGQFQNFFATAIGTSPPTNSLPQSTLTLHSYPSFGSTLHPPTYQPSSCPAPPTADRRICDEFIWRSRAAKRNMNSSRLKICSVYFSLCEN